MALWNIDLTTEDGALGAAQMGGAACFVAAALGAWGTAMSGGLLASQGESAAAVAVVVISLSVILLYLVAGFRLRAGKGAIWGGVAAVLLVLDILLRLAALSFSVALLIDVILLIVVVNGIRGARAFHAGKFDADEVAEIFN